MTQALKKTADGLGLALTIQSDQSPVTIIRARATPRGFRWFSPVSVSTSRRTDFSTAAEALAAGARAFGYKVEA